MNESNWGPKARNLKILLDAGFRVPPFLVIDTDDVLELVTKDGNLIEEKLKKIVQKIAHDLPCEKYAVRSSALIEDNAKHSHAGQFKTVISQDLHGISDAITEVVRHAHSYLKGEMSQFSFIVQEYIEADYAGVAFTRNPLGGREMIVEYHRGIGEDIVSGRVKPERKMVYWNQATISAFLPNFKSAFEDFKKIEKLFEFAQDIEWCVKDSQWYILQSRSITSLSSGQYEASLYLDRELPALTPFFFEKTEISEIASRPTPFTLSLLGLIYKKNGPVHNVYSHYGISYYPHSFLKIIGNELFVDREKEIKTLLPSYSYLKREDFKPHFSSLRGFFSTIKNLFALAKLSLKSVDQLEQTVVKKLSESWQAGESFESVLRDFLQDYRLIFEINLLAKKAVSCLEQAIKSESVSSASILSSSKNKASIQLDSDSWTSNSLEIADTTKFISHGQNTVEDPAFKHWFESLSALKQKYFLPMIQSAQQLNTLREYGRCLTVKHVNRMREALKDPALEYYATMEEIVKNHVSKETCQKRKKEYEEYSKFEFSSKLTSIPLLLLSESFGVSPGKARGKLVRIEDSEKSGEMILYTNMLSPDLTKFFGKIKGIVSESGGLLSHLSIMAREYGVPVVVCSDITRKSILIGDNVEIDGSTGDIAKIEKL